MCMKAGSGEGIQMSMMLPLTHSAGETRRMWSSRSLVAVMACLVLLAAAVTAQAAATLQAQGIECARRTVAKYREALKIAPANLRKAL